MSDSRLTSDRFPLASRYDPEWLRAAASGGANSLWLTEWLASVLELRPGMRVLDLGCGMAAQSIFLRREFGVQVWAVDLWFSAAQNARRVRDAGVEDGVFPMHADARALPFPPEFFDVIVSIDSFPYYGTDETYLPYIARLVKIGGPIAHAGAGLMREIEPPAGHADTQRSQGTGSALVPPHLQAWWTHDLWALHSPEWWRWHWAKTGIVTVETADTMPDGWLRWLEWHRFVAPGNHVEIAALESDRGQYLGYVRVVGRRVAKTLDEPTTTVPTEYAPLPLLRDSAGRR